MNPATFFSLCGLVRVLRSVLLSGCLLVAVSNALIAEENDLYLTKIAPLLKEKCVACHGPVKSEAGLRLDAAKLIREGSTAGAVIKKDSPDQSELLRRVSIDSEERMPPSEAGVALKKEETELLRHWIAQGLPAPEQEEVIASPAEHWAFRPLPTRKPEDGSRTITIDSLLELAHQRKKLSPLATTDKYTLLRRVTLDLTGLPPTREEIQSFLEDESPDAYQQRVDRLLDSPAYGERWARHWMDVWRYSDWDGYKDELRGSQRNIWHWRDWIVESLNANKPYSQMIVEMLAADEMYPLDQHAIRATGFLARNYHRSNRNIWLDATVEHTSKAFLGLTIQCAKCHDHKYDPISQIDYYRYRALFEPHNVRTELVSETSKPEIPRVYDSELNVVTHLFLRGDEKFPDKEKTIAPGVPNDLPISSDFSIEACSLPNDAVMPELSDANVRTATQAARKKCDTALEQLNAAFALKKSQDLDPVSTDGDAGVLVETAKLREAQTALESLQSRLSADKAKHLGSDESLAQSKSKAAIEAEERWMEANAELQWRLAERALKSAENSKSNDDTKKKSAIDKARKDLTKASETYDKWKRKDETIRLKEYTSIVKGYPRQSTGRRSALARWIVDPANPLTARVAVNHIWARHFGDPLVPNTFDFGLKSPRPELMDLLDYLASRFQESGWDMKELHREIVTSQVYRRASSGDESHLQAMKVIDPDNRYLWRYHTLRLEAEAVRDSVLATSKLLDRSMGGPDISHESGETVYRRSLYFRTAYEKQMTMMVLFDAANPSECYIRRPSIVPQQALVLANSTLCRVASRTLGDRIWKETNHDHREFVRLLFVETLNRLPRQDETQACMEYLRSSNLETAHQSLAHVMLNHNDFVTVR